MPSSREYQRMHQHFESTTVPPHRRERGASLIIVMMILIIVAVLGVGGAQIALMGERGARNDRDLQVAFQSAETALYDATNDIEGVSGGTRGNLFNSTSAVNFVAGCGSSGTAKGLCAPAAASATKLTALVELNRLPRVPPLTPSMSLVASYS
ncbi:MAG: hypothetical protein EOO54_21190, partial [Haliea sp.]